MPGQTFSVRVLGLHEDGEWCAIALDMSLRGYGATFEEALEELRDAIEDQVSFAVQHNTLDEIWIPADPQYVELYQRARQKGMRQYLESEDDGVGADEEYAASDMPLPRATRHRFETLA